MNAREYGQRVECIWQSPIAPDIARLQAALTSAGIQPVKPLALVESGMLKRTRTNAVSIAVTVPLGVKIPASVWDMIESGAWSRGNSYVVQLKSA